MARNTRLVDGARVVDATTFGCDRRAIAWASRSNRRGAALHARSGAARLVQQLERDLAIELRIVGGVDHAHAAAPDDVQDHVAPDAHAAGQRGRSPRGRQQRGRATRGDVGAGGRGDELGTRGAGCEVLLRRRAAGGISRPSTNATTVSSSRQATASGAQRSPSPGMLCVSVRACVAGSLSLQQRRRLAAAAARGRAAFPEWPLDDRAFAAHLTSVLARRGGERRRAGGAGDRGSVSGVRLPGAGAGRRGGFHGAPRRDHPRRHRAHRARRGRRRGRAAVRRRAAGRLGAVGRQDRQLRGQGAARSLGGRGRAARGADVAAQQPRRSARARRAPPRNRPAPASSAPRAPTSRSATGPRSRTRSRGAGAGARARAGVAAPAPGQRRHRRQDRQDVRRQPGDRVAMAGGGAREPCSTTSRRHCASAWARRPRSSRRWRALVAAAWI